jgi:hypothetical protein
MRPTDQRLDAEHSEVVEIEDRLVDEEVLVTLPRRIQLGP